jgi:hypothetical protein
LHESDSIPEIEGWIHARKQLKKSQGSKTVLEERDEQTDDTGAEKVDKDSQRHASLCSLVSWQLFKAMEKRMSLPRLTVGNTSAEYVKGTTPRPKTMLANHRTQIESYTVSTYLGGKKP